MPPLKPKLLLWGNPQAGKGKAAGIIPALTGALSENFEVESYLCPGVEDLNRWWRQANFRWSRVLVVGGDGTFARVASHFVGKNVPVNLYPAGAGNDMNHLSKFSTSPKNFAFDYLRAAEKKLDVGTANGQYFFNSLGVGLDAQIATATARFQSWPGKLRYVRALLAEYKKFQPFEAELKIDSVSRAFKATCISIGNGARVGGGFFLTPDAVSDDGILDLCSVEGATPNQIFWNFPKLFKGKHTRLEFTRIYRGKNISIKAPPGTPVHLDGEPARLEFPITIGLAPQKLAFLVKQ
jgi:diacylglycerol kinase family enzyme